ncbi:hypothetical protein BHM03_00015791 [Ensete ventricosum]|nr:hypothetical protein BHM03_00015791 [Ensete ventricosum]
MAEMYRGRATAAAWDEGMACHATLMGMELDSVVPSHSTSDTRSAVDLVPRADVWLPPKCCRGCPSGVGLDESDRPIG